MSLTGVTVDRKGGGGVSVGSSETSTEFDRSDKGTAAGNISSFKWVITPSSTASSITECTNLDHLCEFNESM